jgi:hypothetical protein
MDYVFAVLVALIVMLSIKWVGILIINALLILPAASSRNLAVNMREYHVFSIIFFRFLRCNGTDFVLLHERCNRSNDCNYRICDLFCDLFFRKKVERITGRIEFDRLYFL